MTAYNPTVFVVDDDVALCRSLVWLFSSLDMQIKTFTSAKAFLSSIKPQDRGCLLLDIRMAEMSGLALQKALKEKGIALPIVFLSGHGDVSVAVSAMKLGAVDFINKPFNDQALLDSVNKAIECDRNSNADLEDRLAIQEKIDQLSPQLYQVFVHMMNAETTKAIASHMALAPKSIERYRSFVLQVFEVSSALALLNLMHRHNIGVEDLALAELSA